MSSVRLTSPNFVKIFGSKVGIYMLLLFCEQKNKSLYLQQFRHCTPNVNDRERETMVKAVTV